MQYDYKKLRERIQQVWGKEVLFAKKLGISQRSLSLKLNNIRVFKQPEIQKAIEVLDLSNENIAEYFFTNKVQ